MHKLKKFSLSAMIAIFIATNLIGTLAQPQPAKAVPTEETFSLPAAVKAVLEKVGRVLTMSAMGALINGMSYLTRKLAYDTAKYVASGGKGQGELFNRDSIGDYAKQVGGEVVGEMVGSLGEGMGVNLCQIPDPKLNAFIQIGLRNLFPDGSGGPKPKCDFQKIKASWGKLGDKLDQNYGKGARKFVSETFNNMKTSESDFGISLGAMAEIDGLRAEAIANANLERLINKNVKELKGVISGRTMTPAIQIQRDIESLSAADQHALTSGQIAGIYASELENLPYMAASVFLGTFMTEMLTKLQKGLFEDTPPDQTTGAASAVASFYASSLKSNREVAQRAFSFLLTPTINQIDNYNVLDQLVLNKVVDTSLQQAINLGKNPETAVTIAEALERGYLDALKPLIPPTHQWNSDPEAECYLNGYCYSNLQKLRKARILPLGFELAALSSDPDVPWTLGTVVNKFNECDPETNDSNDGKFPYCHLIDPNWVIKVPQARCITEAYGPELVESGVATRKKECMDMQTCVSVSEDGSCRSWGYCTKEENVWRLDGDVCPEYYSTCLTYKNTTTNISASYLSRTVDFGECSVQSVGCQAYSTEKENGKWVTALTPNGSLRAYGRNQMIYLNNKVETCSASSDGCTVYYGARRIEDPSSAGAEPKEYLDHLFEKNGTAYIRDSANQIHLKKAPDYLGCYDTDRAGADPLEINWPETKTEVLNDLPNTPECSKYAQACAPTEVGCAKYRSVSTGESVPAVVDLNNTCLKECDGYQTFRQEPSTFEAGAFPLYFVPSMASSCSSQNVGCDEFTNMSNSGGGGESLVYYSYTRMCEKPDSVDEKSFISWEGSESQGFVLRRHMLKTLDATATMTGVAFVTDTAPAVAVTDTAVLTFPAGSPAYGDDTSEATIYNYSQCNVVSYRLMIAGTTLPGAASPDCRQFIDDAGKIYYRLLAKTVVIDEQCQKLRKTNVATFNDDAAIATSQTICERRGGFWDEVADPDVCKRCYGGGRFEGNTCVYQALPSESASCAAEESGCRAYTGNTSNNINNNVINDSFEGNPTEIIASWVNAATVATEALQSGQHSIKIAASSNGARTIAANTLTNLGTYELSFWARGAAQTITVYFQQGGNNRGNFTFDPVTSASQAITITDEWREYRLGPTQFTGDSTAATSLMFRYSAGASAGYFMDNVRLSQIQDNIFLIKNSWQRTVNRNGQDIVVNAPTECFGSDISPTGNLPGSALGCRAYTDENQNTYYLTGFSSLCREAAVGCQPVYNSNNSLGQYLGTVYNAVCNLRAGQTATTCNINIAADGTISTVAGGTSLGSCVVPQGKRSCYVSKIELPVHQNQYRVLSDLPAEMTDISTIYIPPESGDPIYLTNRQDFRCPETHRGCMGIGLQDHKIPGEGDNAFAYTDTYVINNPDSYSTILCREDLIGCYEYAAGTNTYYFKDPNKTGNTTCSYRESVGDFNGWFKNGVGSCSNSENLCSADSDCGTNGTCQEIGNIPCYDDYFVEENSYGIWSNSSSDYRGFVGMCDASFNMCTAFIDPQDTSTLNPTGKSYYRIYDKKLKSSSGECEGKVSLKEGCVLFDKADEPNKFYNTQATYSASDRTDPRYGMVNPVSTAGTNNANIILKVQRDRECSEWLACKSKTPYVDTAGNKKALCSKYEACDKIMTRGNRDECGHWAPAAADKSFLNAQLYQSRDVSWYGIDYSGYSLLNRHQIGSYGYFTFSDAADDQFLAAVIPTLAGFTNTCQVVANNNTDGLACGVGNVGRCYKQKCLFTIDGSPFDVPTPVAVPDNSATVLAALRTDLTPASCKGYPEATSPFPQKVADKIVDDLLGSLISEPGSHKVYNNNALFDDPAPRQSRTVFSISNPAFDGVSVCQDVSGCDCNYRKNVYGNNITDYYSTASLAVTALTTPNGVCLGGDRENQPCLKDVDCRVVDPVSGDIESAGTCSRLKQQQFMLGLKGFCLEEDLSRPVNGKASPGEKQDFACQTWLPIQTSASNIDIYNLSVGAGYLPEQDAQYGTERAGEVFCSSIHQGGRYDANDADLGSIAGENIAGQVNSGTFERPSLLSLVSLQNNVDERDYEQCVHSVGPDTFPQSVWPGLANGTTLPSVACYWGVDTAVHYKYYMYRHLLSFAWNRIGAGATVLRFETPVNMPSSEFEFAPWTDPDGDWPGTSDVRIYHSKSIPANIPVSDWMYNLDARNIVNEYNIKDMYFVPLGYKGTIRGPIPSAINYMAGLSDTSLAKNLLRLPISQLKNREIANGSYTPIDGYFVDYDHTDERDQYNFQQNEDNYSTPIRTNIDDKESPLVLWRYVIDRGDVTVNTDPYDTQFTADDIAQNVYRKYVMVVASAGTADYRITIDRPNGCRPDNHASGDSDNDGNDDDNCSHNFQQPRFFRGSVSASGGGNPQLSDGVLTPPTNAAESPFYWINDNDYCQRGYVNSAGVENGWDPHYAPWFAVAVNFDSSGRFIGYTTKWCRGFDTETASSDNENASLGAGIPFAVIADLSNQCTELVKVYDSGQAATIGLTNKAWTNRVWRSNASVTTPTASPAHPSSGYGYYQYDDPATPVVETTPYTLLRKNNTYGPFGSLNILGEDMVDLGNNELVEFDFDGPTRIGAPYSCLYSDPARDMISSANIYTVKDDTVNRERGITGLGVQAWCPFSNTLSGVYTASPYRTLVADGSWAGSAYTALIVSTGVDTDSYPAGVRNNAHKAINQLFAKEFQRARINQSTASYDDTSAIAGAGPEIMDRSDDLFGMVIANTTEDGTYEYLAPPQVFALNPIFCPQDGSAAASPCSAGDKDNITVSGRNGGINEIDYDGDGVISSAEIDSSRDHVAFQSFTANVRFFGFADDNHMPLRRVSVNWDDQQIQNAEVHGYYKNSKPFCAADSADSRGVNALCSTDYTMHTIYTGFLGTINQGLNFPSNLTCKRDGDCPVGMQTGEDQKCFTQMNDAELGIRKPAYTAPRFGNSDRACTTVPFEFEHTYSCITPDVRVGTLDEDTRDRLKALETDSLPVTDDTMVCVFKPRVQLVDNWGYCNGICQTPGNNDGGNFCWTENPTISAGECAWLLNAGDTRTPWTEYKGNIVIVP